MFYKLENNELIKAPNPLSINGKDVFTNDEAIYNEQGFYRLIRGEQPADGAVYIAQYEQIQNKIAESWEKVPSEVIDAQYPQNEEEIVYNAE